MNSFYRQSGASQVLAYVFALILAFALVAAVISTAHADQIPSKQPPVASIEKVPEIVSTGKDDNGQSVMHAEDANVPVPEDGHPIVCFKDANDPDKLLCFYENVKTHQVVALPLKKQVQ